MVQKLYRILRDRKLRREAFRKIDGLHEQLRRKQTHNDKMNQSIKFVGY